MPTHSILYIAYSLFIYIIYTVYLYTLSRATYICVRVGVLSTIDYDEV